MAQFPLIAAAVRGRKITAAKLVVLGSFLVSEDGENPEYDRGVVELIADALGLSPAEDKVAVAEAIGVQQAAIDAWRTPGAS